MKTRLKDLPEIKKQDGSKTTNYIFKNEINDFFIRYFPVYVSGFLFFMFSLVTYQGYKSEMIFIFIMFFILSIISGVYTIQRSVKIQYPHTFYWNPRDYETINIKNSYNYYSSAKLEKITKISFWKFIYFSEYYYKIIFTLLVLPSIGIIIMLIMDVLFGQLVVGVISFILLLLVMMINCIKLCRSMIKTRRLINSEKNNFYYISQNSINLGFTIESNKQGGGDYYFQK